MAQNTQTKQQYIASEMQQVLTNEKYMQYVYKNSQNMFDVSRYLGTALSYLVATGQSPLKTAASTNIADLIYGWDRLVLASGGTLGLDDYEKSRIGKNLGTYGFIEPKKPKLTNAKLYKRILETGVVTHTFNGYNYPAISKYGLGSDQVIDQELAQDINELERLIQKSSYHDGQENTPDEIYYTLPGVKSFFYGFNGAPERLFCGPFARLAYNYPLILGETMEQYFKRVFAKCAKRLFDTDNDQSNEQTQKTVIKIGNRILEKLCSHKPVIAIVPIQNGEHSPMVRQKTLPEYFRDKLPEYLKWLHEKFPEMMPTEFLSKTTANGEKNNTDNLQSTGVVIPPDNIAFLQIPDMIEVASALAYSMGKKPGDIIDVRDTKSKIQQFATYTPTAEENEIIERLKATSNWQVKE